MKKEEKEPTYLIRQRDYADIIKLQDPGVLAEFLDEPATFIAETTMGLIADGRGGWALAGGRIAQSALKAQIFRQFGSEFRRWRENGRIKENFAETKYGYQTWAELMSIIDEETPDLDRLEALKAMFFAVNKIDASDSEVILGYQLWQIAKRMTSGELLLLKTIYEAHDVVEQSQHMGYRAWAEMMAKRGGHGIVGLVDVNEKKLADLALITERTYSDQSGINQQNGRLTDLGIHFCENLKTYAVVVEEDDIKRRAKKG